LQPQTNMNNEEIEKSLNDAENIEEAIAMIVKAEAKAEAKAREKAKAEAEALSKKRRMENNIALARWKQARSEARNN